MADETSSSSGPGSKAAQPLALATRRAAGAAASVAKTQVLRKDRASRELFEARLATCRNCPGGHATFNKQGKLHSCGPMLESLTGEGQSTCGCMLKSKARDVTQSCPLGYWPSVEGQPLTTPAEAPASLPLLPAAAGVLRKLWRPGRRRRMVAPHRRRFLTRSAAALAALALGSKLGPKVMAGDGGDKLCVTLSKCEGGGGPYYARCSDVVGRRVGEVFRDVKGECYAIAAYQPTNPPPADPEIPSIYDWMDPEDRCNDLLCGLYRLDPCDEEDDVLHSRDSALAELVGKAVQLDNTEDGPWYTVALAEEPETAVGINIVDTADVAPCTWFLFQECEGEDQFQTNKELSPGIEDPGVGTVLHGNKCWTLQESKHGQYEDVPQESGVDPTPVDCEDEECGECVFGDNTVITSASRITEVDDLWESLTPEGDAWPLGFNPETATSEAGVWRYQIRIRPSNEDLNGCDEPEPTEWDDGGLWWMLVQFRYDCNRSVWQRRFNEGEFGSYDSLEEAEAAIGNEDYDEFWAGWVDVPIPSVEQGRDGYNYPDSGEDPYFCSRHLLSVVTN